MFNYENLPSGQNSSQPEQPLSQGSAPQVLPLSEQQDSQSRVSNSALVAADASQAQSSSSSWWQSLGSLPSMPWPFSAPDPAQNRRDAERAQEEDAAEVARLSQLHEEARTAAARAMLRLTAATAAAEQSKTAREIAEQALHQARTAREAAEQGLQQTRGRASTSQTSAETAAAEYEALRNPQQSYVESWIYAPPTPASAEALEPVAQRMQAQKEAAEAAQRAVIEAEGMLDLARQTERTSTEALDRARQTDHAATAELIAASKASREAAAVVLEAEGNLRAAETRAQASRLALQALGAGLTEAGSPPVARRVRFPSEEASSVGNHVVLEVRSGPPSPVASLSHPFGVRSVHSSVPNAAAAVPPITPVLSLLANASSRFNDPLAQDSGTRPEGEGATHEIPPSAAARVIYPPGGPLVWRRNSQASQASSGANPEEEGATHEIPPSAAARAVYPPGGPLVLRRNSQVSEVGSRASGVWGSPLLSFTSPEIGPFASQPLPSRSRPVSPGFSLLSDPQSPPFSRPASPTLSTSSSTRSYRHTEDASSETSSVTGTSTPSSTASSPRESATTSTVSISQLQVTFTPALPLFRSRTSTAQSTASISVEFTQGTVTSTVTSSARLSAATHRSTTTSTVGAAVLSSVLPPALSAVPIATAQARPAPANARQANLRCAAPPVAESSVFFSQPATATATATSLSSSATTTVQAATITPIVTATSAATTTARTAVTAAPLSDAAAVRAERVALARARRSRAAIAVVPIPAIPGPAREEVGAITTATATRTATAMTNSQTTETTSGATPAASEPPALIFTAPRSLPVVVESQPVVAPSRASAPPYIHPIRLNPR